MTETQARQHQELIRQNIAAAIERGDLDTAEVLRTAYRPLLAIKFPPLPDTTRVPGSPINSMPDIKL